MKEMWKDIAGYEGKYQVSNLGNVKNNKTNKILKNRKDKHGYFYVALCKNSKVKAMKVHRLVAQTFISNPKNKPEVNHIDGIKTNNLINNLEWVTHNENMDHAWKNHLRDNCFKKGIDSKKSKVIYQIDPKNNQIMNVFYGNRDVKRKTGYDHSSVSKSCRKRYGYRIYHGYIWTYKEDFENG